MSFAFVYCTADLLTYNLWENSLASVWCHTLFTYLWKLSKACSERTDYSQWAPLSHEEGRKKKDGKESKHESRWIRGRGVGGRERVEGIKSKKSTGMNVFWALFYTGNDYLWDLKINPIAPLKKASTIGQQCVHVWAQVGLHPICWNLGSCSAVHLLSSRRPFALGLFDFICSSSSQ